MAKEEKKEKKGFWKEFKDFITRGNVFDMAVGIIVGGAFTAIVNSLCNNILKPIINWILAAIVGTDSLTGVYTFLKTVTTTAEDGTEIIDLASSIYIDWGTFINAIINFILIALVLFLIIKALMKVQNMRDQAKAAIAEAEEKRKADEAAEKAAAEKPDGKGCGGFRGGCSRASGRRAGRTEKGITLKACGSEGFLYLENPQIVWGFSIGLCR